MTGSEGPEEADEDSCAHTTSSDDETTGSEGSKETDEESATPSDEECSDSYDDKYHEINSIYQTRLIKEGREKMGEYAQYRDVNDNFTYDPFTAKKEFLEEAASYFQDAVLEILSEHEPRGRFISAKLLRNGLVKDKKHLAELFWDEDLGQPSVFFFNLYCFSIQKCPQLLPPLYLNKSTF